ncbi:MAG: bifunctional 2-polyprenyl-6-hydroxyphenol methylase/3-demethylubiquinol 3-O-methyltransferase UbiG [Janthinobacterium lividum]
MPASSASTLDPQEVENFEAMAHDWWQPDGAFKALHLLNLPRLQFIRQQITRSHTLNMANPLKPYEGLKMIDIGCGGGILTEPLARSGADITGIDAGYQTIEAARTHAALQNLTIDYRQSTAEECAARSTQYDVVIAMEVVEHVADVSSFIEALSQLAKPNGLVILSTLNRTFKSYGMAILGAEYILRMIPRGTHDWHKFLTPAELARHGRSAGLALQDVQGIRFRPLTYDFVLHADLDVNYLLCAQKILA